MDTSKSKLQITSGKQSKVKLAPKKNYKKKGSEGVDFGTPGFGMTGLEGESK